MQSWRHAFHRSRYTQLRHAIQQSEITGLYQTIKSMGMMLSFPGIAILIAALTAYRMIYPFFHQHPH
jgi:hypothetical protein